MIDLNEIKAYAENNYTSPTSYDELINSFHCNGLKVALIMSIINEKNRFYDDNLIDEIIKENKQYIDEFNNFLEGISDYPETFERFISDGVNGWYLLYKMGKRTLLQKRMDDHPEYFETVWECLYPQEIFPEIIQVNISKNNCDDIIIHIDDPDINSFFNTFQLIHRLNIPELDFKNEQVIPVKMSLNNKGYSRDKEMHEEEVIEINPTNIVKGVISMELTTPMEAVSYKEWFLHLKKIWKIISKEPKKNKSLYTYIEAYSLQYILDKNIPLDNEKISSWINTTLNLNFNDENQLTLYNQYLMDGYSPEKARLGVYIAEQEEKVYFLIKPIVGLKDIFSKAKSSISDYFSSRAEGKFKEEISGCLDTIDSVENILSELGEEDINRFYILVHIFETSLESNDKKSLRSAIQKIRREFDYEI